MKNEPFNITDNMRRKIPKLIRNTKHGLENKFNKKNTEI